MTKRYFGTDGIRGKVGVGPITPEFVLRLGWAVGTVLARAGHGKVIIGKDTRISGYMFESVLESGLTAAGIDTYLLGPMPTPAVAYLTRTFRAQAGVVISASHNPYYDNGIKFFSPQGSKLDDELELAVEMQLEKNMTTVDSSELGKATRIVDAAGRYIEFCKSTVSSELSLSGMKIVVDCAHGANYHIAPSVFRELGATVYEMGVEPNGLNINLNCGATHPESLANMVISENADLGIAFDGDGDRVVFVDKKGRILSGDDLIYFILMYRLQSGHFHGGVVGTVMTNLGFEKALQAQNIPFVRTPVGDRYIGAELRKRGWLIGGESSGHIVCLDKTSTGDGIVTALQVLAALQKKQIALHDWVDQGWVHYPQMMINVRVPDQANPLDQAQIKQAIAQVEHELSDQGRLLIRRSGTEPLIRVMVEGVDETRVQAYAKQLASLVESAAKA